MSALLETIVEKWAQVREENENDKHLINESQRKEWEQYEAQVTSRIKEIIEKYDGNLLSENDSDFLKDLGGRIDEAQRVSREELEEIKIREEAEKERLRKEEEERLLEESKKAALVANTKQNLLGRLGF